MDKKRGAARGLGDISLAEWAGPLLAFAVCVFCFGILLSRLGYFQDDWHHVFYAYWQGAEGLQRFLLTDRGPFAWPVYAGLFRILGFAPSAWHWSLMLIRALTVLVFWMSARRIWPDSRSLTAWLAVIFAVYPIFTLQPLAVAYTLHWAMYLVFMLSILAMLEAIRRPRMAPVYTGVALTLQVMHLALIEYFSGLELARPMLLWLALRDLEPRQRMRQAVKRAIPYLALLLLYAVYRSSYAVMFGYDRFNTLAILTGLLRSPITGLVTIVESALQDLLFILFSQWHAALDPAIIDLSRPSTYLIVGSAVGFAALAYVTFTRADAARTNGEDSAERVHVIMAGLLIVILAMLPFWLTGFSIYHKNQLWSERLALAAMPGASMLVVGIAHLLIEKPQHRHIVLSALLGLAVALQVQTARGFQASWDKQQQLYWQLHWRAPSLEANTLLVADQEILFFMGIYPTAFAVNVLYPQTTPPPVASYWFNAGFEHVDFERFAAGGKLSFEKYGTTFEATAQDVLAITFEPGLDQCLWILRPELASVRTLTEPARTWLEVSDVSQIAALPMNAPETAIFGEEPPRTWCYFFEKADLARQFEMWDEAQRLWSEAVDGGFRAANGVEMVPFIEAHARMGDWATARTLTRQAQVLPDRPTSLLCDVWGELASEVPKSDEKARITLQMQEDLGCQP
jgi:hypothetical protein